VDRHRLLQFEARELFFRGAFCEFVAVNLRLRNEVDVDIAVADMQRLEGLRELGNVGGHFLAGFLHGCTLM